SARCSHDAAADALCSAEATARFTEGSFAATGLARNDAVPDASATSAHRTSAHREARAGLRVRCVSTRAARASLGATMATTPDGAGAATSFAAADSRASVWGVGNESWLFVKTTRVVRP